MLTENICPFGDPWSHDSTLVFRVSGEPLVRGRALFELEAKRLRDKAIASLGSLTPEQNEALRSWELHHIVPLSFSGARDRVALVPPGMHKWLHWQLNSQVNCRLVDQKKIAVPSLPGLVWGFDPKEPGCTKYTEAWFESLNLPRLRLPTHIHDMIRQKKRARRPRKKNGEAPDPQPK